MSDQKLISIIIPVYNQEKYICCCLDSILDTNSSLVEVICVDDGSTDRSPEILKGYENRFGIKVLRQKNSGVSSARNYGLDNASGQFIWFIDSDDFIMRGCLPQIILALQERDIDVAEIGWQSVHSSADWQNYKPKKIEYKFTEKVESTSTVYGSIISKKLIDKYHIRFNSNLHYAEDTLFQYYVYLHTEKMIRMQVTTPVYLHRNNPESAMHSNRQENIRKHTLDLIELGRIYSNECCVKNCKIHDVMKLQNTQYRVYLSILGALTILPKCDLNKQEVLEVLKNEGLYPYPWIWWHIRTTHGTKSKIVEIIKLPFVWEWYYNVYYWARRKLHCT